MINTKKVQVAFVLSTYFVVLAALSGVFDYSFDGSPSYSRAAMRYLETGSFGTAYRPPLYPLYLAGCISLFGEQWQLAAIAGQILFAVSCLALTVAIAIRLSDSEWIPGVVGILWMSNLALNVEFLKQRETALFIFLQMAGISAFVLCGNVWKRAALVSLFAGLAHLTRPSGILPLILLGGVLLLPDDRDRSIGLRARRCIHFAVAALLFAGIILPWQRFVGRVSGHMSVGSSSMLGPNLWKGNNPYLWDYYPGMEVDAIQGVMREVAGYDSAVPADVFELDPIFLEQAKEFIFGDPVGFAGRTLYKALMFFSPIPVPYATGTIVRQGNHAVIIAKDPIHPVSFACYTAFSFVLLIGACFYFFRLRNILAAPPMRSFLCLLTAYLLLSVGLHAALFYEYRFRFPLEPLLVVLAAIGYSVRLPVRSSAKVIETAIGRFGVAPCANVFEDPLRKAAGGR